MDYDDAYANAPYIPGADDILNGLADTAERFRSKLGSRANLAISYGPSDRQAFDHFLPVGKPEGILIFVHGGYWLRFDRSYWSHFASGALERGWAVAMPSYDLCPDVRISCITQQIAQAVMQIADETEGPIALSGHSAGGHLVSRMMAPGMLSQSVMDRVIHVAPISPLADLEPLIHTQMNDAFRMDKDMARAESPMLQPVPVIPATVWVGADERPVFLDQAMWLGDAWQCKQVVVPNRHHFDIIDDLADPNSEMVKSLIESAVK